MKTIALILSMLVGGHMASQVTINEFVASNSLERDSH